MKSQEFISETIGKRYDIDGYYGAQCWDYFALLCQKLGYKITNCTSSGYVKDIWNDRKTNGVLTNFIEVSTNKMKYGDVVIFSENRETPLSHIGVFVGLNENGNRAMIQSQNQGASYVNVVSFSLSGILGVLRPKSWNTIDFPITDSGQVIALYDHIRIRDYPSLETGLTGDWYNTGMSLNYNKIVKADGWYWLEYTSYSGKTHYCAYATEDLKTIYWKQNNVVQP